MYTDDVHTCIYRYSRRIMWLCASRSNNRPDYVAKLFITCIRNVGGGFAAMIKKKLIWCWLLKIGCPAILRTDLGTDNSTIAVIQAALRQDEKKSSLWQVSD